MTVGGSVAVASAPLRTVASAACMTWQRSESKSSEPTATSHFHSDSQSLSLSRPRSLSLSLFCWFSLSDLSFGPSRSLDPRP